MRVLASLLIGTLIVLVFCFWVIPKWQVWRAQSFCGSLADQLEVARDKTGEFPKQISSVLIQEITVPYLAKARSFGNLNSQICGYSSHIYNGRARYEMSLSVVDRYCLLCAYKFDSDQKKWYLWMD